MQAHAILRRDVGTRRRSPETCWLCKAPKSIPCRKS